MRLTTAPIRPAWKDATRCPRRDHVASAASTHNLETDLESSADVHDARPGLFGRLPHDRNAGRARRRRSMELKQPQPESRALAA